MSFFAPVHCGTENVFLPLGVVTRRRLFSLTVTVEVCMGLLFMLLLLVDIVVISKAFRRVAMNRSAVCHFAESYGAVGCGQVRSGADFVLENRAVRYGTVRCGTVRCGAVRCGAVRCGAVRICFRFSYGAVKTGRNRTAPYPRRSKILDFKDPKA